MSKSIHKDQRLKSEKQIQFLFQRGKSIFMYPVKAQYIFEKNENEKNGGLQFGVSVSKKHFKKAVDRNLFKRRMREAFRLQKDELETALLETSSRLTIMFLFIAKEDVAYGDISLAIGQIVKKLVKKCR